jgi:hypothetical protein
MRTKVKDKVVSGFFATVWFIVAILCIVYVIAMLEVLV